MKMKTLYSKLILLFILIVAIGCKEDDTMSNTNVSKVEKLYAPSDNTFYNLGANSSALFEWQAAHAEDNGVVVYEVAFDKANGDFSNPIKVIPADGNGYRTTLNITFADLNKIAEMAGIQPEETGKLRWTVFSSKGINVQKSDVYRTIEVQRPGGFPTPDELYITGTASETGTDIASAIPFKKVSSSVFEIYTKLSAGTYQFASRKTGTPLVYYLDTKLKKDGSTTYTGDSKVYRIRVDFSTGGYTMDEITAIQLWFAPDSKFLFSYNYAGKGTWNALNKKIVFKAESWGRDERYKFKMSIKSKDGNTSDEWWGSSKQDNPRPDNNTAPSFWYLVPAPSNQWDNCFKFKAEDDNANVNGLIDFSATATAYTHSFTVI